jgi:hypothetical protein
MYLHSEGFRDESGGYVREALRSIAADPLGWLALRARNLGVAVLTPHGTSDLGGPSIKLLAASWLRDDGSLRGLWGIMAARNFTLKLVIYAFHYYALILAAAGAVVSIRRWRERFVIYAVIAYLLAAYGLLTVLPRYLFPAEVFLWILAGVGAAAFRRDEKPSHRSQARVETSSA